MKNFYIIDNNIIYSSGLESLLRSVNHSVTVNHGHHGEEHAYKEIQVVKPDIVIMDLVFPGFDGMSFIHRLQESQETNFIPIAIYTQHDNRYLRASSFDKGVDHFFIKEDFPPHILIDRLFKIYGKRPFKS